MNIVNSVKNTILDNVKALRTGIKNFLTEEQNLPDDAPRKLRGKQTEVFEALLKPEFSDEDIARGYFKLPTGFGKTVMFAHLTKSFLNETSDSKKKILVLVPRINLLEQTDEKFDKFIGVDTSYFYSKEKDTSSRVIISTYQSLSNLLKNINKEDIDLVIADEAHHALGENTSKLFKDLQKYAPTIAFTATPNYSNDKKLANLFSKEIYSMTTIDAVQNNMLVPVKNILLRSSIEFDLSQVKKKSDGNFDYEKIASSISMDTLSKEIAKAYLYGEDKDEEGNSFRFFGKKAMINCPNVKTAIAQAEKINELAGQVIAKPIFQHMGMSSRFGKFDETVEDFKNNKFLIACQVNTLTEGFDDTEVSISINYPTASAVREEQSAGRALRINEKDPNKVAYVIDTVFSVGNDDENPFETAQKAGQVVFSDVAGASVIFPENFKHKKGKKDKGGFPLPPPDMKIPEFKIFTDTEKLLQVFNDGKIQVKDENWYSSKDLSELLGDAERGTYLAYLKKVFVSTDSKFKDLKRYIQYRRSEESGLISLCLHKDALELFKQVCFSNDWIPLYFLAKKVGSIKYVQMCLDRIKDLPEFDKKIQIRGFYETIYLHESVINLFKEKLDEMFPMKTDEWISATDFDQMFVGKSDDKLKEFEEFSKHPNFAGKFKLMRNHNNFSKCMHKSAIPLYKEIYGRKEKKINIKDVSIKTKEWLSAEDLRIKFGGRDIFNSLLKLAAKNKKFEGNVKLFKKSEKSTRGSYHLHESALDLFKEEFKDYLVDLPHKTASWLSTLDLRDFFAGGDKKMKENLDKALKMDEFKVKVENNIQPQVMKMLSRTQTSVFLHIDALDKFQKCFNLKKREDKMFEEAIKKIKQKIAMEEEVQKTKNAISKTIPDDKKER